MDELKTFVVGYKPDPITWRVEIPQSGNRQLTIQELLNAAQAIVDDMKGRTSLHVTPSTTISNVRFAGACPNIFENPPCVVGYFVPQENESAVMSWVVN